MRLGGGPVTSQDLTISALVQLETVKVVKDTNRKGSNLFLVGAFLVSFFGQQLPRSCLVIQPIGDPGPADHNDLISG